jgi:hypothetical protein
MCHCIFGCVFINVSKLYLQILDENLTIKYSSVLGCVTVFLCVFLSMLRRVMLSSYLE